MAESYTRAGERVDGAFVVPAGSRAVGGRFERILAGGGSQWVVVLELTGDDPISVWNDLADAIEREGYGAVPARGSCAAGQARLDCTASASTETGDGQAAATVLWLVYKAQAHHIVVERTVTSEPAQERSTGTVSSSEDISSRTPRPRRERPDVAPGEEFGNEVNCFEAGYDRFRLPLEAAVATSPIPAMSDDLQVVFTNDAAAAIADLAAQMTVNSNGATVGVETRRRADGTLRWAEHSVEGGGGYCQLVASADGDAVLLRRHSD